MNAFDRRVYQRGSHLSADAKISTDRQNWQAADVYNVSSSGLQLHTGLMCEVGDILWLDMVMHCFFAEFEVKTQCIVRRKVRKDVKHIYGVSFKGLSQDIRIRIDENVSQDRPVSYGVYTPDR